MKNNLINMVRQHKFKRIKKEQYISFLIIVLFALAASTIFYLSSSTLLSSDVIGKAGEVFSNKEDSFKFLVVADIPSSMKSINPPSHTAAAIASMQVLQAPPAELIIFNGNMISGLDKTQYPGSAGLPNYEGIVNNKWQAFYEQIFKPLSAKGMIQVPAPGSLDTTITEPKLLSEAYKEFWNNHKPSVSIKGNYPWWYSFNHKNSHFIILDTSNFAIMQEQLSWLEDDLSSAKKDTIFVITHTPPEAFCNDPACASLQSNSEKQQLFQIMKKYNVKIVFTGNNHIYYKARYQGVNVVASGAIAGTFTIISTEPEKFKQNPSYVVVDVQGTDIRVGAITGNNGPTFTNGFTESLLPSFMPGYDIYTELTKNPVNIIPTVIPSATAGIKAAGSSGNPQMDQWDQLIIDACKQEQDQRECFALVKAVMYVESGGNPNAGLKKKGCLGLMQFCRIAAIDKRFKEFFDQTTLGTANDDRLNPEKSIRAGKKFVIDFLTKEMHIDNIFIMYVGYNVGASYGKKAKDYFQGKDPTQVEVEAWLEQTDLTKEKVNESKIAFPKLIKQYLLYKGQGISSVSYPDASVSAYGASNLERINAPSAISYYITPSFTLDQNAAQNSLSVYDKLHEYMRWYIKNTESCTNAGQLLESCSQESITSLNKEPYFAANIGVMSDCTDQESEVEKFFYDFVEEIKGCMAHQGEKMCAIKLEAPPQKADEKYSLMFRQDEGKIIIELQLNNNPLTQFTHTLQEIVDAKAILLTDAPNRDGSKTILNEFYITFEQLNNHLTPFIYYRKQGSEDIQGVTTSTLYLMPDQEQNIIILDPVIGNTQKIDADKLDAVQAAQTTQASVKKLCIASLEQQPMHYLEALNPLQSRPLTYELAVKFDTAIATTENFFDPMPTFLDLKSSEVSLEQLQLELKDKKIAILADVQGIKGKENNGFITQLTKSLPTTSITTYAKDAPAQWLKDNYFQQEIITQEYDILILALGSSDVCDAVEFRNLVNAVSIMASQFKTAGQGHKLFVVGLSGLDQEDNPTCNNNILRYNAAVNKNDQNNDAVIKQLAKELGKSLSLKQIDVGLDIYPETNLASAETKYKYHHAALEKRKELPIIHVSEDQVQMMVTQKILEGLRGLQPETNNLGCKNVFAVGTSSTAWALENEGYIVRLKKQYPQIVFDGKGYKSASSKEVAEQFETQILPGIIGKVDCLVVAAGLNDIGNLENVKQNLAHIYTLAHKNRMKVVGIELQPYFQKASNPNAYSNTKALNSWLAAEADIEAVIKIYDAMNDPEHEGRMQLKFVPSYDGKLDFLHYNYEEGHKLVAEELAKTIFGGSKNNNH